MNNVDLSKREPQKRLNPNAPRKRERVKAANAAVAVNHPRLCLGLFSARADGCVFGLPWCAISDDVAYHALVDTFGNTCQLWRVGEFDPHTGKIRRIKPYVVEVKNEEV